jgi:hypothetical protein
MNEKDVKGERTLIAAILNNAIGDAIGFRNPQPSPSGKNEKEREAERHSYAARNFLRKENKLLRFYCNLIDIDPDYLCEKAHKYIKRFDNNESVRSEICL